jgi:hypothetical protein
LWLCGPWGKYLLYENEIFYARSIKLFEIKVIFQ